MLFIGFLVAVFLVTFIGGLLRDLFGSVRNDPRRTGDDISTIRSRRP